MAAKKTPAKKTTTKLVPETAFVANARLVAARQDANIIAAAGIRNGMSQEECDERILKVLAASATDTSGNAAA